MRTFFKFIRIAFSKRKGFANGLFHVAQNFSNFFTYFRRAIHNVDSTFAHHFFLCLSGIFTSTHDGTGMTHSSSRRGSFTSNKTNDRFCYPTLFVPLSCIYFKLTSNLSYHHHSFTFRIIYQHFQGFLCSSSNNWITSNSDGRSNSKTLFYHLVGSFVSKGSRF